MSSTRFHFRAALAACASVLLLASSLRAGAVDDEITAPTTPSVPGPFEVRVDVHPTEDNTATSVGSIQVCRRVVGLADDPFEADIVIFNAPPFHRIEGLVVAYDETAVDVASVDLAQMLTSTDMEFMPMPPNAPPLWHIDDPDGPLRLLIIPEATVQCAKPIPLCFCDEPSGSGVLARVTFKIVDPSKQTGIDIVPEPMLFGCAGQWVNPPGFSLKALAQVVLDAPEAPDRGCWTCNSTDDDADFIPDGISDTFDSGFGIVKSTLRSAIMEANRPGSGPNRISFNTPGAPVFMPTIQPMFPLSDHNGGTTIDGSTQAGVTIDGSLIGGLSGPGLKMLTSDNVIRLVDVINVSGIAGIEITTAFDAGLGVFSVADNNLIEGCRIGIDSDDVVAPNLVGVLITGGARDNQIGSAELGNVISGNFGDGVLITGVGTTGNQVRNNHIGADTAGLAAKGNGFAGVAVKNAEGNVIGGPQEADRNVISANGAEGVLLMFAGAHDNLVQNNWIGLSATGEGLFGMGNGEEGVELSFGAHDNLVGGDTGGIAGGALITGNVIALAAGDGILITGVGSDGNLVHNNIIGSDPTGVLPLGNGLSGVSILNGPRFNEIGGSIAGQENRLVDNVLRGVHITNASDNTIQNNMIGVGATGGALGNGLSGVRIDVGSTDNSVTGNTILANGVDGVSVWDPGTTGNTITANFIGSVALPNAADGVNIFNGALGNLVSNNAIGNNDADGIHLEGADGNIVTGNTVLGNLAHGVHISNGSTANVIGGDFLLAHNLISGNLLNGVFIDGGFSNRIKLNEITWSGLSGVAVIDGVDNSIRINTILNNGPVIASLGIDLGPAGVTLNDVDDLDAGANDLQNFPVLSSAVDGDGTVTVTGTLDSTPSTAFLLDFYGNIACDTSGFGEASNYLGSATVVTSGSGDVTFAVALPLAGPITSITATATDPGVPAFPDDGNTSEFAACVIVTPLVPCPANLDASGAVNGLDLAMLLGAWTGAASYTPCPPFAAADLNGDCRVNGLDLAMLLAAWGPCA